MPGDAASADVDTLILVDVDGVLNVGVRDPGEPPLLFNATNVECAQRHWNAAAPVRASSREFGSVTRIVKVAERALGPGNGQDATYAKLVAGSSSSLSDVLVGNLVRILEAAGPRSSVVLSSTWRKPQHQARVKALEACVSKHLGKPFTFDGRTHLTEERSAADRLRTIGEYLASLKRPASAPRLRVVILEDFCITPMKGWSCGGVEIGSSFDAEKYMCRCAGGASRASVKLVHTYEAWTASGGLYVEVGMGLQARHVEEAREFLDCSNTASEPEVESDPDTVIGDKDARALAKASRAIDQLVSNAKGDKRIVAKEIPLSFSGICSMLRMGQGYSLSPMQMCP
eukprot:TRINITY_DN3332_c5_g1_i1.p1 TRINITY_DN3332_c5_g1~~TRINITY_DN3332_c5_g1_i1.p1  ORF type:complete len:343 (-),score=64.80 TRINITY_DN3332_c5_g1_i1:149-1177(-)